MKFVVFVCIGPGEREVERLGDLLLSLAHFEPQQDTIILLVNDGNSHRRLEEVLDQHTFARTMILTNPRNGRGTAWSDGLTVGVLTGLAWIAQHEPRVDFILKLDTDSLIIAPFGAKLQSFFDEHADVGLIGSYLRLPDGSQSNSISVWSPRIRKLTRLITIWRIGNRWRFQFGFCGRARRIRKLVSSAINAHYIPGESCIGGGYALAGPSLRKIFEAGLLEDCFLFLHRPITEDVVVSLFVRSVGQRLADLNHSDEPFGVWWRNLHWTPTELLQRGYSIIHSVKDSATHRESETRAFFAITRNTNNLED